MKNPITKLFTFMTGKYKAFTYKIWDNKYEIWDVSLPKFIGFPMWFIATILFVLFYIPFGILNFFMPKDED